MDVVADFPADAQAAEPVQVGKGAFDDPALGTEAGTVFGATAGDDRFHPECPDEAAVLVVVVAAVAEDDVRPTAGPSALAPHRRDRFE